MSLIFASRCSSVSRFVLHVQTDDTFPNKPNRFHMWQDRSERVGASSSHQRDHTSIQQFIKAHFLLFYWQTDTTVVIILLSDSMKSNCCWSFCWQALVSLPQASAPTRRTALTYKSFNGNQSGLRLTGPLRTSLHAPAFTFTQRDDRKYGGMWRRKPAAELHQWFSRFHIFIIKLKHYNVTQNF